MARILVIDDDKSIRTAIGTLLRHQDCVPVLADSSHLVTKAIDASEFDLVMVDIFTPAMDGLETIKGFRKVAPTVPIVAMSGFEFRNATAPAPDFLGMAAKLGATYCLRKPFGAQQLMAAINACLGGSLSSDGAAPA